MTLVQVTVRVPKAMREEIERLIRANPELGYQGINDFVVAALREYVLRWRAMHPEGRT